MAVSGAVVGIPGLALAYGALVHPPLSRFRPVRRATDFVLAAIPGVRRILRLSSAARYAGILATLLDARIPTARAVARAAQVEPNSRLAGPYTLAAGEVERGTALGEALRRARVPEPLPWLVAAAEGSGRVPAALREAGAALEARLLTSLALLRRASLPALVLLLGLTVGATASVVFQTLTASLREAMW
jgi:type IV pilus assembly protein PilC